MFFSIVMSKNIVKTHHVLKSGLVTRILSDGRDSELYFKTWISTYVMVCTFMTPTVTTTTPSRLPVSIPGSEVYFSYTSIGANTATNQDLGKCIFILIFLQGHL